MLCFDSLGVVACVSQRALARPSPRWWSRLALGGSPRLLSAVVSSAGPPAASSKVSKSMVLVSEIGGKNVVFYCYHYHVENQYHVENTGSRSINKVKEGRAW